MLDIKTDNPNIYLTSPEPERDAKFAHGWFTSKYGKETLLLMGNAESEISPSTIESERAIMEEFVELENDHKQLTWMIRDRDTTIGAVWIELIDTHEVKSPAVHIMIGDAMYRGKGIGQLVVKEMIQYTRASLGAHSIYSRHLANNGGAKRLLRSVGFENDGEAYTDDNDLVWQNVQLEL